MRTLRRVIGIGFSGLTLLAWTAAVHAQGIGGIDSARGRLNNIGRRVFGNEYFLLVTGTTQAGGNPVVVIVVRIINVALTLVSVVLLGLILYGGWLWMTARGEEEQIDKAKDVITHAVVGVIIVVASWAITVFIVNSVISATGIPDAGNL